MTDTKEEVRVGNVEDSDIGTQESVSKPNGLGIRHLQSLLLFFCITANYMMRVNISVGIVLMTDHSSTTDAPVFDWTMEQQSQVQSAFFYGYFVMNVIGSVVVARVNNWVLLLVSTTVTSCLTVSTPALVINGGLPVFIVIRMVLGLMQGFMMACTLGQLSRWVPQSERGRCITMAMGGIQFGTIISFTSTGWMGSNFGWPLVFYVPGALGIIWVLVWMMFGAESPQTCKYISDTERYYIEKELASTMSVPKNVKIPWLQMLKSKACWAVLLVGVFHNWAFWTLIDEMPSYFKAVLNFGSTSNGIVSSLPYASLWISYFFISYASDSMVKSKKRSLTFNRKLFNTIGHWGACVTLIVLSYTTNEILVTAMYIMCTTLMGFTLMGFGINTLDILPNFAGFFTGITNGVSNISGIFAPILVGAIVTESTNELQWRIIFLVSAFALFVANTIFITMGSGEVLEFNEIPEMAKPSQEKKMSIISICSRP